MITPSQGLKNVKNTAETIKRTLNDAKTRFNTTEKELLAIVGATKHFGHFLYDKRFEILTDHKLL